MAGPVTYTLIDWSSASESGVQLADFDLVYIGSGVASLSIADSKLLLNSSTGGTLFKFR